MQKQQSIIDMIERERDRRGWSNARLADELRIRHAHLNKILAGSIGLSWELLIAINHNLGLDLDMREARWPASTE